MIGMGISLGLGFIRSLLCRRRTSLGSGHSFSGGRSSERLRGSNSLSRAGLLSGGWLSSGWLTVGGGGALVLGSGILGSVILICYSERGIEGREEGRS